MPWRPIQLLLLASIAGAVPTCWLQRGRPDLALACAGALAAATLLPRLFAGAGLDLRGALGAVWLLPFSAAWGLGEGLALFERVAWWDLLTHALGGAMAFALFHAWTGPRLRAPPAAVAALAALLALSVGALWELGELASDAWLHTTTQAGNTDTMLDLALDLAGAGAAALVLGGRAALRALAGRSRETLLYARDRGA